MDILVEADDPPNENSLVESCTRTAAKSGAYRRLRRIRRRDPQEAHFRKASADALKPSWRIADHLIAQNLVQEFVTECNRIDPQLIRLIHRRLKPIGVVTRMENQQRRGSQAARNRRQAPRECSRIASRFADAIAGGSVVQIIRRPSHV